MNFENVRFHEVLLKAFDRDSLKTLVRELRVRTAIGSRPAGMTAQRELIAGPDGNLWFTTENQGPPDLPGLAGIAKINPSTGAVQQFYLPSGSEANQQITFGPDANIWFADWEIGSGYFMSRMDPSTGAVKDFPLGREIGVGPITKILSDARAEYDLHSACYLADIDRVRALVADPIKKRAPDKEAMRIAATYGQEKIVKLLLDHGADPEDADFGELTVSYFAIEHASVLKLLFDAGANPKVPVTYRGNGAGPEGSTLLHEAAEKGNIDSAKLLLTQGLEVDVTNIRGGTPLHVACRNGQAAMVDFLLKNKANAKARTKDGWTPMSLAASQVRPEMEEDNTHYQSVIRKLERGGVEVDIFGAIACNDIGRVATILRDDAKAGERRNPAGRPALQRAVTLDRTEIAKLLLDKGCDPDIRSEEKWSGHEGETALLNASFWGHLEMAKILIMHGANVNAKAAHNVTPLHEAARMKHLELAELLLKHGADVNAKDDKGKAPLDWANSNGGAPEMTKLLRSHGGQAKEPK